LPEEEDVYKEYLTPPVALFLKELTPQGLVQYMNDTTNTAYGAGVIINSEVGDEFNTNPNFPDLIKLLSEAFDLGVLEATYTKGKEFRNDGVSGVPINALYVGAQAMLMFNETIKHKFIATFMSKLSRRSFFCYSPEILPEEDFLESDNPTREMYKVAKLKKMQAKEYRNELANIVLKITESTIKCNAEYLTLDDETDYLLEVLKRYDYEVGMNDCNPDSIESLAIRNRYWKCLKLAGALALLDSQTVIKPKHLVGAINISEMFSKDLMLFEKDLNKAPHEKFSDYIKTKAESGKATISAHDIKKGGYLSSTTKNKLQELVTLCAGYDKNGIYTVVNDGVAVQYEAVAKTDVVGVSFKPIDIEDLNQAVQQKDTELVKKIKERIAYTAQYGYEFAETEFSKLGNMLSGNFAYSPFKYTNGIRGRDNVISGTKFLVLDIDDSLMSADEMHFMLNDINHYIALSSDPDNEYKFRIIIELDAVVTLDAVTWKHFYLNIAKDLALKVDPLPQSQIFYSYAGRKVLSQLESEPLYVRDYVMEAIETTNNKEVAKPVPNSKKEAMLQDIENTFSYACYTKQGARSRNLIRAAYHAKDLGADKERIKQILNDINEYMDSPLEERRFNKIIGQIDRM
jgi:hypothetical protein